MYENETSLTDWGKDLGKKALHFSKGRNKLDVDHAGKAEGYGWTYAVTFYRR